MRGGEYITGDALAHAWSAIEEALHRELALFTGTVADYLHDKNPLWRVVGRVCFHLAENKRDPAYPFAFMAPTPASSQSAVAFATRRSRTRFANSPMIATG